MKNSLQKVFKLLEQNRKLDPFYKEKVSEEFFERVFGELSEAKEEYNKGNNEELKSEMGDILWIVFMLLDKLEDEGKIDKKEVFEKIYNKMSKRKTFLLENREVSREEAIKIWNDAKRKEGYDESRLWNE